MNFQIRYKMLLIGKIHKAAASPPGRFTVCIEWGRLGPRASLNALENLLIFSLLPEFEARIVHLLV